MSFVLHNPPRFIQYCNVTTPTPIFTFQTCQGVPTKWTKYCIHSFIPFTCFSRFKQYLLVLGHVDQPSNTVKPFKPCLTKLGSI